MNPHRSLQNVFFPAIAVFASIASGFAATPAPATHDRVATDRMIEAPKPQDPYEGQRRRPHGSGVFLLRTIIQSGHVTQVIVGQSPGDPLRDAAVVKALRQWRLNPGLLIPRDIQNPRLDPPISKEECL